METSRFVAVVGTLAGLTAVVALVALYLAGSALGGLFGGGRGADAEPPDRQQRFAAIVRAGQEAAEDANDVQLVQARLDRDEALCALEDPYDVRGWWGTVEDIGTELVGEDALLVVELDDDVELVVRGDGSVAPGSDLFAALSELDDGDDVRVDGRLVADPEGCVEERSVRLRNSLATPDFGFEPTGVERR